METHTHTQELRSGLMLTRTRCTGPDPNFYPASCISYYSEFHFYGVVGVPMHIRFQKMRVVGTVTVVFQDGGDQQGALQHCLLLGASTRKSCFMKMCFTVILY